ncbi:queuine tRNA-ribosyltransferase accessory subunit 2 [Pleurodeles waltl]|uniref:queuine tRNA-ribosyltransferase accessory subunit 2 n=1 Tax=Pleurodeles waltl TaxID=8319 RepID=UPI003709C353
MLPEAFLRMQLNLSKVVNGCRLGAVTHLGQNGEKTLEFPGCLLYTRTGSAPHLTHDTLHTIEGLPAMTHITLSSLAEHHEVLEEYKEGIGKFAGMTDAVLYCSLHDPVTAVPGGYNTNKTVSVWGGGGRLELSVPKFMTIQQALQADWFQCLSDGELVPGGNSKKRVKKSVDRSLAFLDQCLTLQQESEVLKKSLLIGAIEGGDVLDERLRSARETAKRPVGGFLLDGFQDQAMDKETKLSLIEAVTAVLPEDKPRLIHGLGKPHEVLECVERGVDLFDSSYPFQVTERGCALTFSHTHHPDPETAVLEQNVNQDAVKSSEERAQNGEPDSSSDDKTPFEMCLKDKRYWDDFDPVVPGCSCYCCHNHSRAYIHHLLMSKELLAGILLMIHNFHHYFSFFRSVREALKDGQIHKLKELVFRQAQ